MKRPLEFLDLSLLPLEFHPQLEKMKLKPLKLHKNWVITPIRISKH